MNALERDDRFGIGGMAEYARGYSWRPSERRELNEGATYRRDWQPQGDLFALVRRSLSVPLRYCLACL